MKKTKIVSGKCAKLIPLIAGTKLRGTICNRGGKLGGLGQNIFKWLKSVCICVEFPP